MKQKPETSHKGNVFNGIRGGKNYKRGASLLGLKTDFYKKGIGDIKPGKGMKALDLGCGPGALSFALAEKAYEDSLITGIDLSEDQLNFARKNSGQFRCSLEFRNISMDELPFPDNHFDIVMTSMALHETPPEVRRGAIKETARVLRKGGTFILVDWSRPVSVIMRVLWSPLLLSGKNSRDNWYNIYPELCAASGLQLKEDYYINSFARRQLFIKEGESHENTVIA